MFGMKKPGDTLRYKEQSFLSGTQIPPEGRNAEIGAYLRGRGAKISKGGTPYVRLPTSRFFSCKMNELKLIEG